jgi:hypothetical protein
MGISTCLPKKKKKMIKHLFWDGNYSYSFEKVKKEKTLDKVFIVPFTVKSVQKSYDFNYYYYFLIFPLF